MKYIVYNKRTCVTGKKLFDYLSEMQPGQWRRKMNGRYPFPRGVESVVVWGNSLIDLPVEMSGIVLNAKSVNASDKLIMIERIKEIAPTIIPLSDLAAPAYIRDRNDHVRLGYELRNGDKYATVPVDKDKEWRVHVMFGRTMGVYEKVPYDASNADIRKDDNCSFVRLDLSNDEIRASVRGVRPIAKKAVELLELDFGGVDVIRDKSSGALYVNEVNSAPALNSLNIERWGNMIISRLQE